MAIRRAQGSSRGSSERRHLIVESIAQLGPGIELVSGIDRGGLLKRTSEHLDTIRLNEAGMLALGVAFDEASIAAVIEAYCSKVECTSA